MAPTSMETARRIVSLIDLTNLADDHSVDGIDELIERAQRWSTAAVCVWPEFVKIAADRLAATNVNVATVADFPAGAGDIESILATVNGAIDDGADEVDLVLAYRAFLDGERGEAADVISTVADVVHEAGRHLKVILETGALPTRELIVEAGQLAVDSGADFIKTSTGKIAQGASIEAIDAMIDVVAAADRPIGLKPSGGIGTVAAAAEYLDLVERRLGAERATPEFFRFGASSLLADAERVIDAAS